MNLIVMYPQFCYFVDDVVVTIFAGGLAYSYFGYLEERKFIYRQIVNQFSEPPEAASRKFKRLEVTYIYYLKNWVRNENLSPITTKRE